MSSQVENSYNPFKLEWSYSTGSVGICVTTLLVTAVAAGVISLLALHGVHVGPFNALAHLKTLGGWILTGVAGALIPLDLAWLILLVKNRSNKPPVELEIPLNTIDFTAPKPLPEPALNVENNESYSSAVVSLVFYKAYPEKALAFAHCLKDEEVIKMYRDLSPTPYLQTLFACRLARVQMDAMHKQPFNFSEDIVIPVCESGVEHSMVVYGILKLMYPELTVLPPFGAKNGIDPSGELKSWLKHPHMEASSSFNEEYKQFFHFPPPAPYGTEAAQALEMDFSSEEWEAFSSTILAEKYPESFAPPGFLKTRKANRKINTAKSLKLGEWVDENVYRLNEKHPERRVVLMPLTEKSASIVRERIPKKMENPPHILEGLNLPKKFAIYGLTCVFLDQIVYNWQQH